MKKTLVLVSILLLLSSFLFAQSEESNIIISPAVRLFGADIDLGYSGISFLEGVDTILWLELGGGWEGKTYFRHPSPSTYTPGDPYIGTEETFDSAAPPFQHTRVNFDWALGLAQGILWNEVTDSNLLEGFLYYRGRYDSYQNNPDVQQLIHNSNLPDADGIVQNSLYTGITYDTVVENSDHKTKTGFEAEVTFEWGPSFLANNIIGYANFSRFNLTTKGFFTVFDAAPEQDNNLFSIYLADFFSVDYAFGEYVPINVLQTFGGRYPRTGLGGAIRGVNDAAYDSPFKVVNNLEARFLLPAIYLQNIVPGFVTYFDASYYGPRTSNTEDGVLLSTGAGFFINILDLAYLGVYSDYFINGVNAKGEHWTPIRALFGLHF
ncbi:MAG: hypothetical protein ACLFR1_03805 [Spirochaetia bacterium]